jgi:2-dehydropantoate 2-reductase
MRIGIVGAGGMGSAVAGLLAAAGEHVVLVGRADGASAAHVGAITSGGLRIDRPDGTTAVTHPVATADPSTLATGSLDALVLLTKTFDSGPAMAAVAHALAAGGVAASWQNGLGNDRAVAAAVGPGRALIGVTTIGAHRHEPGRITITGSTAAGASVTQMGPPTGVDPEPSAAAAAVDLARRCTAAGLPTTYNPQVAHDIWNKLALAVMGPFSAVMRRSVQHTWEQPAARELVRRMFDEVVDVAAAEGVALDREVSWAHAVRTYEGTGDHTTSMCTDVLLGRRTEIDAMAGEVARRGALTGVPTPLHDTIAGLVRAIEASYQYAR